MLAGREQQGWNVLQVRVYSKDEKDGLKNTSLAPRLADTSGGFVLETIH